MLKEMIAHAQRAMCGFFSRENNDFLL